MRTKQNVTFLKKLYGNTWHLVAEEVVGVMVLKKKTASWEIWDIKRVCSEPLVCSVVVFVCFALCGINKTKKTTECHRCWPQSHQRRSAMHLQIWPLTVTPPLLHICMRQTSEIDHICRTVQYVWNGECALLCLAAVLLCSIFLRSYSVWVFFYCECLYRQIFPLFLHVNILLF